jgi:hypothetical protein
MRRLVCRLLSVCVVSAVPGSLTFDRGFAQSSEQRVQRLRQRTFNVVWKTVNDKYFDPQFGGVDRAAVRRTHEAQLTSIMDDAEFYELLSQMFAEIKISHLRILEFASLDRQLARAVVTRGLALRDTSDQPLTGNRRPNSHRG